MGDSWEYRVLFEYAGMNPPDFHEDVIQLVIDGLGDLWEGLCSAQNAVTKDLAELAGSISSEAFDEIENRWVSDGKPAMMHVWTTISDYQTGLGRVLTAIEHFKANLVLAVGGFDIVHSINLASIGEGIVNVVKGEFETIVQGKKHTHHLKSGGAIANLIQDRLQELESEIANMIVSNTPLKEYEEKFANGIQQMISKSLNSAGTAAAGY